LTISGPVQSRIRNTLRWLVRALGDVLGGHDPVIDVGHTVESYRDRLTSTAVALPYPGAKQAIL